MSVSKSIKALLTLTNKKQRDLLEPLGKTNPQGLSNKFAGERWSASDLVKIAEYTGSKLAFILPDGERVVIAADDPGEGTRGVSAEAVGGGVTHTTIREEEKDLM